jgi:hypothetical protein
VADRLQAANTAPAVPPPPAAVLWEAGKRLLTPEAPAPAAPRPPTPMPPPPRPSPSLLWDLLIEARVIVRMYVDPRYRMSWWGRLALVLLIAFVLTRLWVPFASLALFGISPIEKAADLVLGFILFKLLGYEVRRYRETAPDLPPSMRL